MRCPSTSDLVQAHSNRAYDKMEVISDHIHEIMELYEWIFNLREYLASKLAMYVSLQKDEFIQGQKSLLKTLRVPSLRLASIVENLTDEGNISIGTYNNDPALLITFAQEIDDDTVVGTVAMAINRATETPYFAIPATKGDEDTSAVRVDYLNQVIAALGSGSDALTQRVKVLEDKMDIVYPFDTEPTENSEKGVTSGGVFSAIQTAINAIDFPETVFPVASKLQKGIMQVGDYLLVNDGLVSVDWATIKAYIDAAITAQFNMNAAAKMYGAVIEDWTQDNDHDYTSRLNEDVSVLNNVSGDVIEPRHIIRVFTVVGTEGVTPLTHAQGDYSPDCCCVYIWKNDNYTLTTEDKAAINEYTGGFEISQLSGYTITHDSGEVE